MDVSGRGARCRPSGMGFIGYGVEALDGSIGKIDQATYDAGSAYIVVDTGPRIFGKKVMLPAGTIRSADHDEEKVFVNRTKDQIKDAPEFDDSLIGDEGYRTELGSYDGHGRCRLPRLGRLAVTGSPGRARSTSHSSECSAPPLRKVAHTVKRIPMTCTLPTVPGL